MAEVDGERVTLQGFALRSMASGAAFHRAYPRATQQAFLEAHELAFHYFGGVFRRLRYDNLSAAVKKILRGHRREETARFVAFRSHWGFDAVFCNPGEGHEKGGVEGEVGTFRRNHWVPVPQARDLDELNARLLASCRDDEGRTITGREHTVGAALAVERDHLLPLPREGYALAEVSVARVDGLGSVRVRTNAYSAPLPPGTTVEVRLLPATVEVWHQGRCVARHARGPTVVTRKCWTWSITWTCSNASRARWRGASPSTSGAAPGAGPPVTTACGRRSSSATGRRQAPRP
jgi:hypothetical protein